jgi:ribonuclease VapC
MVIDTSVIIALIRGESTTEQLTRALKYAERNVLSAATSVEIGVVTNRSLSVADAARVPRLIAAFDIEIADFTSAQAAIAQRAHERFGQGSGHPARLNFGDCFSYALAIALDEPLLFVGDDFSRTDVTPALARD